MKIKALRPLNGHYGQKNPGDEFDVSESLGRQLVERGVASKVKGAAPRMGKPEKVENKASAGPLAGSPTGGAAQRSSSAGVQVRTRSRSKKRKVALGSSS